MDDQNDEKDCCCGGHLPKTVLASSHKYGGGYYYRPGDLVLGGSPDDRQWVEDSMRKEGLLVGKGTVINDGVSRVILRDERSVPDVVARYRNRRDRPATAQVAPNYVFLGASHMVPFPGGPPHALPPSSFTETEPPEEDPRGNHVTIAILDSGIDPSHAWLKPPMVERLQPNMEDEPETEGVLLRQYAGHGSHIAGVVRRHAPGAKVLVHKLFGADGDADDITLAEALQSLPGDVDIVNLSLGTYGHDNEAPIATAAALAEYRLRRRGTVVVASAGNDADARPVFPAAFKSVIGVGALGPRGERACFSNFGWWVDSCTDGVEVESAFVHFAGEPVPVTPRRGCPERTSGNRRPFEGFASWSGTSFAAPKVAAAIACAMTNGLSATEAASGLLDDPAVPRVSQLGAVVELQPAF